MTSSTVGWCTSDQHPVDDRAGRRQPGNLLRLSLVASPRVEQPVTRPRTPARRLAPPGPRLRAARPPGAGQTGLRPLTRLSPDPSTELWRQMLPESTRVSRPAPGVRRLTTTPDESFVQAADAIGAVYDDTGTAAQVLAALRGLPGDGRVAAALPASARAAGLVRLDRISGAELAATSRTLRRQGQPRRRAGAADRRPRPPAAHRRHAQVGPPAPFDGVDPIERRPTSTSSSACCSTTRCSPSPSACGSTSPCRPPASMGSA